MATAHHGTKERYVFFAWALLSILSIITGLLVVESTENKRFQKNQRGSVVEKLSTIRARLESGLNSELLLARSIIIDVETNTDITKERFFKIAQHFMKASDHIKNIGLAKGTVLTYVYPVKGNEKAIGIDYKKITSQWPAVQRVIEGRKTVVAGPLNLMQGGVGIIGRTPIYTGKGKTGSDTGEYFGILSVVINLPSMLEAAGLNNKDSLLNISIRGKDGLGSKGEVFYGSEGLFANDSVFMEITLPGGRWQMASVPVNGWVMQSPLIIYYRVVSIVVGLVILFLLFIQHSEMIKRNKVEEELKESEMLLKETQRIAKMGGWEYDVQTNVAIFTDMIFEIYGETISDPEDGIKFYHIDDRMLVSQSFENAVANNKPYDIEARFQNSQGDNLWVRTIGKPVVEDGKVVKIIGNLMDITEWKKVENQLKRSSSILNATQQLAKIGGWELDQKTQSIFWTDEVYRIHGFQLDEFTSLDESVKLSIECYDPEDQQIVVDAFKKCTEEGQAYDFELPFTTTKGRRMWIRTLAKPIMENGKVIKVVGCFMDITERKKLEEKLRQSQKMESIGTLAGGIAHDFNNILFPIVGYTEMLMEDFPEGSPFRDSLNEIYTGALRARDLVQQILAFSRQGTSELKLIKMQTIIKEALKLVRATIPTTISINQNIQPDCDTVKADPIQIHQIVMNLCTNAYHAMEETGGELKVGLKQMKLGTRDLINPDMIPGQYACLTVVDTGIGMDKELTQRIFDPFFTTKAIGKGTGMGLSVVHGIVEGIGGAIQVYSEPGKGTQFYVYFPIEKSSFVNNSIQTHETIQYGTETILLVDDEDAIIAMEKLMLERLGYQVTSRNSSIEALEAFRDSPDKFNLVITDMAMPNMPGDKLAVELTKIRPNIPVLLCTGFSETMSDEKAASLGINGFLLKPIVMKDLSQKIREVLDKE